MLTRIICTGAVFVGLVSHLLPREVTTVVTPAESMHEILIHHSQPCASERRLAASTIGVLDDSVGTSPLLITWNKPPALPPQGNQSFARGSGPSMVVSTGRRETNIRYAVRIDTMGKPIASSADLRGVSDDRWQKNITDAMKKNTYVPARIGECTVEALMVLPMVISDQGQLLEPAQMKLPPAQRVTTDCMEFRRQVAANGGDVSGDTVYPPAPLTLFLPPLPVPSSVKGSTIKIVARVDADGWAIMEKSAIRGSADGKYQAVLLAMLKNMDFAPARNAHGCRFEGTHNIVFRL